jgi:hypothetical protein
MAWSTIPCVGEQGIYLTEQGIKSSHQGIYRVIRELSAADVGPLLNARTKVPKLQSTRGSP